MSDLLIAACQEPRGAVRRRLVGAALRRYREHLGFGLTEAASILDCDRSKISRIETGQRGIRPSELGDLLTEYGISGIERALLLAITDPRLTRHGLWNQYADIVPAAHLDLMILELFASQILIYDPQQIPDLLQTQDYTHAAAQADPGIPDPGTISRLTEMNMIRRKIITDAHSTTVTAVIGEAALHQQIGNPDIMRDQLRHLADATSTSPWDSLQILPFEATPHPRHTGSMSILRFAEAPSLGVVHLHGLNGGVILTGQAAIADHVRAFTQLQTSALPPKQSAGMLAEMTETSNYAATSRE
jgi:transcriptional regulator with XRE-family HTH domain